MWTFIGAGLVIAAWLFVRWGGGDVRYVGQTVGRALNIKRHIIEEMLLKMGQERSAMLAKQLKSFPDVVMPDAVITLFVYQVAKNSHPKNVSWWKARLEERGFSAELSAENVETAFMYLRDAGESFGVVEAHKFLDAYQTQFGGSG